MKILGLVDSLINKLCIKNYFNKSFYSELMFISIHSQKRCKKYKFY